LLFEPVIKEYRNNVVRHQAKKGVRIAEVNKIQNKTA
jgi:hypothetical protein